jgi:hypothetical protein
VPNAGPIATSAPDKSRLDDLPPDQRAALSLLLDRGKSYAEISRVLGIPQSAVRDRAHAALDAIGGDPVEPPPRRSPSPPASAPLRDPSAPPASPLRDPSAPPASLSLDPRSATSPSRDPSAPSAVARASAALPSSRLGGALLLGGLVAGVVVAVILLSGGGGSRARSAGASGKGATSTTASTATSAKGPTVSAKISLTSPNPASKAIGIVEVLSEGSQRAFYLAAEHMAPSRGFFYAVWLYNSPSSFEALGRSPNVGSDGRMAGGALLPANASKYHRIVLTRETANPPPRPGQIVLGGAFSVGG